MMRQWGSKGYGNGKSKHSESTEIERCKQGFEMEETGPAKQAEQRGEMRMCLLSSILKVRAKGAVS